jgi:hypothetical protein
MWYPYSFNVPVLCPSESLSCGSINEGRVVPSCYKCSACVRIDANVRLARVARVTEFPMHRPQELDQVIMALPSPKFLVSVAANFLAFLGV